MRARDVIGRRIVGVRQVRFFNDNTRSFDVDVLAIVLDNGAELVPITIETGGSEYAHSIAVRPAPKP